MTRTMSLVTFVPQVVVLASKVALVGGRAWLLSFSSLKRMTFTGVWLECRFQQRDGHLLVGIHARLQVGVGELLIVPVVVHGHEVALHALPVLVRRKIEERRLRTR